MSHNHNNNISSMGGAGGNFMQQKSQQIWRQIQSYYSNEFQIVKALFENTEEIYKIIFLILIILVAYYCGKKSAQRNILIDRKLKTQFLDAENKKKKLLKKQRLYENILNKVKTWIYMFYVFTILFTVSSLAFSYFILNGFSPIFQFIINFEQSFNNLLILIGVVVLIAGLFLSKIFFTKQITVLEKERKKETAQESDIEKKILDILGNVLSERIKAKLLKDEQKSIEKQRKLISAQIQEKMLHFQTEKQSFQKDLERSQNHGRQLEQQNTNLQKQYNILQTQKQEQISQNNGKKLDKSKNVKNNINNDNFRHQRSQSINSTGLACNNEMCKFSKDIMSKKIDICEQFINQLGKYEWCQKCQNQYFNNSSDKNQAESDEILCEKECVKGYFIACKKIGQAYITSDQEIRQKKDEFKQQKVNQQKLQKQ